MIQKYLGIGFSQTAKTQSHTEEAHLSAFPWSSGVKDNV